jgi:predicted O-linked N-acetylglucosamine transferase (SPINDLY family)/thioredoxin-like negative regulator of GroEL
MTNDERLAAAHAAFQRKDYPAVLRLLASTMSELTGNEFALALIANSATLSGQHEPAVAALDHLTALRPDKPAYPRMLSQVLNQRGAVARRSRRDAQAEGDYLRALATWPGNTDARFNLAQLYVDHRRYDAALPLWRDLLAVDHADMATRLGCADCLARTGNIDAGRSVLAGLDGASVPADLRRRLVEVAARLGMTGLTGRTLAMIDAAPGDAAALFALGDDLAGASDIVNAVGAYRLAGKALDDGRRSPGLRATLAAQLALPAVYRDLADIDAHRARYAGNLAALDAELPPQRIDDAEKSLRQLAWSNFYLAYQGRDDRDLQQRYGTWLSRIAPRFAGITHRSSRSRPGGVARIALVGSIFRRCTAGSYFASWVRLLAGMGYEVSVYQLGPAFDDLTDAIAATAHVLHRVDDGIDALARELHVQDFDLILYPEIGMDMRVLPLAALRLARRQACAWGHPTTTGLPSIDAFFSCAAMEPENAQDHYSESLRLLPGLGTDYTRPDPPAPASRAELGLPDGRHLYLLPQSLFKMHPDNDAVMTQIVAKDPAAQLVLFRGEGGAAFAPYRHRIDAAFRAEGLDPDRHLLFLPMGGRERFLQINRQCDVMVDTLHWSGGNTSLDALTCALPLVTCPGKLMRSRQSSAMLLGMALDELVVETPAMLAAAAVEIACDPAKRAALSRRIDAALPTLFDTSELAEALRAHVEDLLAR